MPLSIVGFWVPEDTGIPSCMPLPALRDCLLTQRLLNLGIDALQKYMTQGDFQTLEVSVRLFRLVTRIPRDGHVMQYMKDSALDMLCVSLHERYILTGDYRDLEEAITHQQRANALTPDTSTEKHARLSNLVASLLCRFGREERSEDLDEAIQLGTRAIELVPDTHSNKPKLLNNLGISLLTRFNNSEAPADDLDRAISLLSHAIDLTPDSDTQKPSWVANLADVYARRFVRFGNLEDIERAITLGCQSVDLSPDSDPKKPVRLFNVGTSLHTRFEQLGTVEDLWRSIQFQSQAIELTPDNHTVKPVFLSGYSHSLYSRHERTWCAEDLEEAITCQTRAIELTQDRSPDKASMLNALAVKLRTRFFRSGGLEDLNVAIAHSINAVKLTSDTHPDKQLCLHNLALSLWQRFVKVGDAADLEDAIRRSTQSVDLKLLPENDSHRAQSFQVRGRLFRARLCSPHACADDMAHAMEAFLEAMQHPNSPPLRRLWAYSDYADLLTEFPNHITTSPPLTVLEAYGHALSLIPQCIWLGNDARDRYSSEGLLAASTIANDAVTAAIKASEYGRALEWLETSRAIVWSQILQLRTPVDDLRHLHPQLADKLDNVFQVLRRTTSETPRLVTLEDTLVTATGSPHGHVLQYQKLLARIRELEGFETFLRPRTLPQLAGACATGPVVVINTHRSRCDALILYHPGVVKHVPLPSISKDYAEKLRGNLWSILDAKFLRGRFRGESEGDFDNRAIRKGSKCTRNDSMYDILEDLWNMVVKPILDVIRTLLPIGANAESLPHVTWCPTGPLAFLPLHAAGIYRKTVHGTVLETIMDHAVSSYTPTLEALLRPRPQVDHTGQAPPMLIVSQPETPGCKPIPATTKEAAVVMSVFDVKSNVTILEGENGTVGKVLSNMATHKWVHLACHGTQNQDDPTKSAFLLHDGPLTLTKLMSHSLPNADLAVLSACQTATGDKRLAEEAVHLAAGMLNLGYKSVIGTMWSIYDDSAPIAMGEFYRVMVEQVKKGGELQPAYALHEATKALRVKYGVTDFMRWIPFIHCGL